MKKLSVSTLALVAALVAAPVVAHADTTPGWYVGGGLGAAMGQDQIRHADTGEHSERDSDVDLSFQGSGGYAWAQGYRLEAEYFHDQINGNHIDKFGASGHTLNNDAFLNGLYDFQTHSRFTPYVGAGLGADFVDVENMGDHHFGYLRGDTTALAYQGIAGVAIAMDQNWAITADYRYVASLDAKVDNTAGGQGRTDNASHNFMIGARYSFGTPMAPAPMHQASAPMVAPHAAGRPPVSDVGQNFMVFFDFNKSTLTPEAKRIIASAAQEYKKDGYAMITVTGHTDTSGTATYNQKLSDRRAMAVEAELKRLGVETSHIKEMGVGENGLMVPTAQGVREAQNRRAEIVLSK